jgi:bifunctional non-homologous end joining protein LigD
VRLERDSDRVRLITKGGYNSPTTIRGSSRRRARSAKAVSLSTARRSCSASMALPTSTRYIAASGEVQLYVFDILALDGDDQRRLPLSMRKTNLARLLARQPEGIFVAPFEQGEIGPDLFRAAWGATE